MNLLTGLLILIFIVINYFYIDAYNRVATELRHLKHAISNTSKAEEKAEEKAEAESHDPMTKLKNVVLYGLKGAADQLKN